MTNLQRQKHFYYFVWICLDLPGFPTGVPGCLTCGRLDDAFFYNKYLNMHIKPDFYMCACI